MSSQSYRRLHVREAVFHAACKVSTNYFIGAALSSVLTVAIRAKNVPMRCTRVIYVRPYILVVSVFAEDVQTWSKCIENVIGACVFAIFRKHITGNL